MKKFYSTRVYAVFACLTFVVLAGCTKEDLPGANVISEKLQDVTATYAGGSFTLGTGIQSFKPISSSYNEPLPYVFQYKEYDAASGTYASDWTDGLPSWLIATAPSGNSTDGFGGSTAGETIELTVAPQAGTDPHHDALAAKSAKTDFDLSTVNVATGLTVETTTANCYVVQAPGTYKFPVVYGNGIVKGSTNEYAYRATTDGTTFMPQEGTANYLGTFKNYNDNYITSPYIATDLNNVNLTAKLIWTDVLGLVDNVSISGTGQNAYISFNVPAETITQGNALIAVLDGGTIAWSWHIWVTDEDLTKIKAGPDGYYFVPGYFFAPVNLGWSENAKAYAGRKCRVRIVQGGNSTIFSNEAVITQTEGFELIGAGNPYYQWGRKDPLQASDGSIDNVNKTLYYEDSNYAPQNGVHGRVSLGVAIQTPYVHHTSGNTQPYDWCSITYQNTWNSRLNEQSLTTVVKTIYDPSPVGFKVPPLDAIGGFNTSNFPVVGTSGSLGFGRQLANGLFFPAMGERHFRDDYLDGVWTSGRYWSAMAGSESLGFSLNFSDSDALGGNGRPRTSGCSVRPVAE